MPIPFRAKKTHTTLPHNQCACLLGRSEQEEQDTIHISY